MQLNGLSSLGRLIPERLTKAAWLRPRFPLLGIELRDDAVLVTRVRRARDGYHLAGQARVELPEGVFGTSKMSPVVGDGPRLARAVSEALTNSGAEGVTRASLALPDPAARVSLLDFQEVPPGREQVLELIRWRLKKIAPFPLDDALISWEDLGRAEDGRVHLLVAVAPAEGVGAIEKIFETLGIRVGVVDLASFDTFNALRLSKAFDGGGEVGQDRAVLTVAPSYFSLIVTRGDRVIFYRAKSHDIAGTGAGPNLGLVTRELKTSLSYYEEHLLGEGVGSIHVRVVGLDEEPVLEEVRSAGCGLVEPVRTSKLLPELATLPEEVAADLIPSIGLAMRREP